MKASNAISSRNPLPAGQAGTRNGPSSSSTAEPGGAGSGTSSPGRASPGRAGRFALEGPSTALDERIHAFRRDIADIGLAGQVIAPHYSRPMLRSCGLRPTLMRYKPAADAVIGSELLPGEQFAVLEIAGGWAWGYSRHDHYVGYVEAIALTEPAAPTHIVAAAFAPVHPKPDVGAATLTRLPMGARLRGEARDGFLATEFGFLPLTDVRDVGATERDPVAVAQRLIGVPYLLGGRTATGIDCSGLVQLSLALCGIPAPRDSDQQRVLGAPLPDGAALQRGDLVFFEGHVGFMIDGDRLLHATAHAGQVVAEPLAAVHARNPIQQRRRLSDGVEG